MLPLVGLAWEYLLVLFIDYGFVTEYTFYSEHLRFEVCEQC